MIKSAKNKKMNNSGFTLVEVLVAVVILAIISLPVLSTFSNAARINAKARRTENANTAINNIIEEAKETALDELISEKGKYYYQLVGSSGNTYVVSDKTGDSTRVDYFTGVDGEQYYIRAKIDAGAYTNSDSSDKVSSNNINSAGLSVYADVSSGNNFVYRDDEADSKAVKEFQKYSSGITSNDITKSTVVDVKFEQTQPAPNLKIRQTVTVSVVYNYKDSGVYPPVKYDASFDEYIFVPKSYESEGKTKYIVSTKEKNNAKSIYMFYMPFKGEYVSYSGKVDTTATTDDKLTMNITYPTIEDVTFSDINIYMMQQEKIVKNGSNYEKKTLDLSNIVINTNGAGVNASAYKGSGAVSVYSNITGWNGKLQKATNEKNVLYRMTVDVWLWRDVKEDIKEGNEPSADKIASVTTTKED